MLQLRAGKLLAILALFAAFGGAYAQDEPRSSARAEDSESRSLPKRKETLELPGLTACHQCEWYPSLTEMAAEQCGANPGVYECGRVPDCEKKCVFVKCVGQ